MLTNQEGGKCAKQVGRPSINANRPSEGSLIATSVREPIPNAADHESTSSGLESTLICCTGMFPVAAPRGQVVSAVAEVCVSCASILSLFGWGSRTEIHGQPRDGSQLASDGSHPTRKPPILRLAPAVAPGQPRRPCERCCDPWARVRGTKKDRHQLLPIRRKVVQLSKSRHGVRHEYGNGRVGAGVSMLGNFRGNLRQVDLSVEWSVLSKIARRNAYLSRRQPRSS